MNITIPEAFPDSMLEAAKTYRDLGFVVQPLYGPKDGNDNQRGKKPRMQGYKDSKFLGLDTDAKLGAAFANGNRNNIGIVVRPPQVIVDLDSYKDGKKDGGAGVHAWLERHSELAKVPAEETPAGGVHLHFICKDAPKPSGGVIKKDITKDLHAEIFTGPANVVASPSRHANGGVYKWLRKGKVPEVSWAFLERTFAPETKQENRTGRGDWRTLDIVALAKDLGIYGKRISGEKPKHSIKCPWHDEHSTKGDFSDTSTAIFEAENGGLPNFKCLHGHCEGRRLKHLLAWAEEERPGIVNTHCEKMLTEQLGGAFDADLTERYGDPFMQNAEGRVTGIGEAFWAGLYATENVMLWEPEEQKFYLYDASTGLYLSTTRDSIKRDMSALLLREGRSRGVRGMERWRSDGSLNHLVAQLRGIAERRGAFADRPQAVHLANGVIDFSEGGACLVEFSPHFYSRNAAPISFDPDADCPRFLNDLVIPAVHPEDVSLLQRYAGMGLLGRNLVQRILILDGLAGRGKSTFSSILQRVVGLANCTQLRTENLTERFETNRYIGKTLLIGVDVDPDFLRARGASVLKGLVGGDNLDTEAKGVADTCKIKGDFLVIITANSRLRVRLQRDIDAWRRRLAIVRYEGPPPAKKIPDLAEHLVRTEGAGILNWALAGLAQVYREVDEHGDLLFTPRQLGIVNSLLEESESLRVFLTECLDRREDADLSVNEIMEAYYDFCPMRGWEALPSTAAQGQLPNLMLELFRLSRRNDIKRGTHVRGFKGVALKEGVNP
jgi:P4 family phage/plasmid primase-like protien